MDSTAQTAPRDSNIIHELVSRVTHCKHPKENIYIFREREMMMNAVFAADAESYSDAVFTADSGLGSDAVFAADFSMNSDAELGGRGKTDFR